MASVPFRFWKYVHLFYKRNITGERGRLSRDRMVVGFTTACTISAYQHYESCELESRSWRVVHKINEHTFKTEKVPRPCVKSFVFYYLDDWVVTGSSENVSIWLKYHEQMKTNMTTKCENKRCSWQFVYIRNLICNTVNVVLDTFSLEPVTTQSSK
jgi:hypothetical protein